MEKPFKIAFSNELAASAIRVQDSADLSVALREVGLDRPRPTLVLVGGAGGMSDTDLARLRPLFVKTLAPLAEALGAFVVDGGTDVGVMRLMGQARAETGATFPLVGVAVAGTVALPDVAPSRPDAAPLEPHHTHFVLAPGSDWVDGVPWLTRVAGELAGEAPSVTVLVNGGEIAREDVAHSVAVGRPVVVVAGTGRLADEIAAASDRPTLLHVVNLAEGLQKVAAVVKSLLLKGASVNKFDEYKFFAEATQGLSDRRQAATQTYLTVNTAIFAVLAFLIKDGGFREWGLVAVTLPLFLVGGLACSIWYKIITQYRALIGWRYDQLMAMEQAVPESHQMYLKEWDDFFKPRRGKEKFGFSRLEIWLPRLFLGLYVIYGVGLVVATALGWW